jgi:hypothetical protein
MSIDYKEIAAEAVRREAKRMDVLHEAEVLNEIQKRMLGLAGGVGNDAAIEEIIHAIETLASILEEHITNL